MINEEGRHLFTCSYALNGEERSLDIWAFDWEEALAIVAAIRETLTVDYEILERDEK